jgi:hypothetical protein
VSVLDGVLLELLDAAGALLEPLDGVLADPLDDGALLEPLAALPLDAGGVPEALELDDPPEAGALGDAELDDEELLSLSLLMSTEAEPEAEPEGAVAGEVVEPADDDEAPEGGVVLETVASPSRSHPASNPAPSARDTATARFVSFM